MKKRTAACMAAIMLMLSGCAEEAPEAAETSAEVTTTTVSPYLLARGWDGQELLDSIYYCGKKRPLPMKLEDYPDILFYETDNIIALPDGSHAWAYKNDENVIYRLVFSRGTAPADLNIYGISFDARPDDIPSVIGAANRVDGDPAKDIIYRFYDGGIGELTFVFKNKILEEIHIASPAV